jgi:hypothetical protein
MRWANIVTISLGAVLVALLMADNYDGIIGNTHRSIEVSLHLYGESI